MRASQLDELRRAVAYGIGETRRFGDVLGDVEATCLPTGAAPDALLCKAVRAERDRTRVFARILEQHADRLRGAR